MAADTIILYDRTGAPIAYTLEDGETLYTYTGRPVGFLQGDGIFSFQGRFLAWYLQGWVVDSDGTRLFFTKHSEGGPVKPLRGIEPLRGIRQYCPGRGNPFGKGLKPAFSLFWSPRSGKAFFPEPVISVVRSPAPRPGRAMDEATAPATAEDADGGA
jgi:YD repeat-containing protein